MKVGYIDYLNCYPFYHTMFQEKKLEGIEIVPAYPGELNKMIAEAKLDISPVSAGAFPEFQEEVTVLPSFCLSSVGYVKSVILSSKIPIEELDNKTVGLTRASKTSVVLLKILLEKYYNVKPNYIITEPNPNFTNIDGALIIGNEAMEESKNPIQYTYDLGDLWLRKTGFPIVFAIFVIRNDALKNQTKKIQEIVDLYSQSMIYFYNNENEVVSAAKKKYPHIHYDINYYYQLIKFDFTDKLKEALNFYFNSAAELGFLKKVEKINFL